MADDVLRLEVQRTVEQIIARHGALAAITFVMLPLPLNKFHIVAVEAGASEIDVDRLSNHLLDRMRKVPS